MIATRTIEFGTERLVDANGVFTASGEMVAKNYDGIVATGGTILATGTNFITTYGSAVASTLVVLFLLYIGYAKAKGLIMKKF